MNPRILLWIGAAALAQTPETHPTLTLQDAISQGEGTPSGIFVVNDGMHVYNEQGVVREELFSAVRHGGLNRALPAEAVARAKVEIAARGLNATVIQNYYAILRAQHRIANARQSVQESEQFLAITEKQERGVIQVNRILRRFEFSYLGEAFHFES